MSTANQQFSIQPDAAIEPFGEAAIVALLSSDRLLTVNAAAAELLQLIVDSFGQRKFAAVELAELMLAQYELGAEAATREAVKVCDFWLAYDVFISVAQAA